MQYESLEGSLRHDISNNVLKNALAVFHRPSTSLFTILPSITTLTAVFRPKSISGVQAILSNSELSVTLSTIMKLLFVDHALSSAKCITAITLLCSYLAPFLGARQLFAVRNADISQTFSITIISLLVGYQFLAQLRSLYESVPFSRPAIVTTFPNFSDNQYLYADAQALKSLTRCVARSSPVLSWSEVLTIHQLKEEMQPWCHQAPPSLPHPLSQRNCLYHTHQDSVLRRNVESVKASLDKVLSLITEETVDKDCLKRIECVLRLRLEVLMTLTKLPIS